MSDKQAENLALKSASTTTDKLTDENHTLKRTLANLEHEVEHLRIQDTANKNVLAEKYELQRKCTELDSALAHAQREAQRALAKRRNTMHDMAQADELETLQKSLAREKRLREKAVETAEELQHRLDGQTEAAQHTNAVETAKVESDGRLEVQNQELSTEVKGLKKDNAKLLKDKKDLETTWQERLELWTEKVESFKAKNKALRTSMQDMQARLDEADKAVEPKKKPPRKRAAAQIETDVTTLGTPGDKGPTRGRKKAKVGEKSNFSMTPFLNKTMTMIAEDEPPSPVPRQSDPKPVKANQDSVSRQSESKLVEVDQNKMTVPLRDETSKKPKLKAPRKSVVHFASFSQEPEAEKKKKRKMPGRGTLFDDDDDAPRPKVGFAPRLMPKGSLLIGGRKGALATTDGFSFSPRKYAR